MIRALLLVATCGGGLPIVAAPLEHAEPDPGLDPTVLHSRVKVTNEFVDREFDVSRNKTKLLLAY